MRYYAPQFQPPVPTPYQETEETRLRRELAEAQAKLQRMQKARTCNVKISEKGAVSVYGLGRFPVTLYADQWRMLLGQAEVIEQFLIDNESKLARKEG